MIRICVLTLSLFVAVPLSLGCGRSDSRRLQSITINQTANGGQVQFTASGTFSAPPITVAPLAVSWGMGLFAPPPPGNLRYALTTQPYVFDCPDSGPAAVPVSVLAPSDPYAPMSGSLPFKEMITAYAQVQCP